MPSRCSRVASPCTRSSPAILRGVIAGRARRRVASTAVAAAASSESEAHDSTTRTKPASTSRSSPAASERSAETTRSRAPGYEATPGAARRRTSSSVMRRRRMPWGRAAAKLVTTSAVARARLGRPLGAGRVVETSTTLRDVRSFPAKADAAKKLVHSAEAALSSSRAASRPTRPSPPSLP